MRHVVYYTCDVLRDQLYCPSPLRRGAYTGINVENEKPSLEAGRHELFGRCNDLLDRHGLAGILEVENIADLVTCAQEEVNVVFGM